MRIKNINKDINYLYCGKLSNQKIFKANKITLINLNTIKVKITQLENLS